MFSFGGYIQRRNVLEKKRKKMSPENSPHHAKKKEHTHTKKGYIWEADVLPLHHKRVVETTRPRRFVGSFIIRSYFVVYASRKSNPRLQLFSLIKEEEFLSSKKKKTKFSFRPFCFRV